MSLFDDDFYSPKVSPWKQRQWKTANDRWPASRRWRMRPLAAAASGVAGVALLLLLTAPLWNGGSDGAPPAGNAGAGPAAGAAEPIGVVDIVERLKPTVVSVVSLQDVAFGDEEPTEQETGLGSGIIYEKDGGTGRVVTNHHVIEGAGSIEVVLADGRRLDAKLVGSDALTDLAVLEIDAREVGHVAEFGDSDTLKEGEAAIAIGHPFGLGYAPTSTLGIISSLHRLIPISLAMDGQIDWEMELLQTDAAINHGNSGGALVNLEGKVIGINSMKVAQAGVEGLGFAIPSNTVLPIIDELERHGKVRRPYLGVATIDLEQYRFSGESEDVLKLPDDVENGIIVLEAFGPAAEAGLQTNDVIVALDGKPIHSTLALRKYLYANKAIGDSIRIDYYRGGEKRSAETKLTENPD